MRQTFTLFSSVNITFFFNYSLNALPVLFRGTYMWNQTQKPITLLLYINRDIYTYLYQPLKTSIILLFISLSNDKYFLFVSYFYPGFIQTIVSVFYFRTVLSLMKQLQYQWPVISFQQTSVSSLPMLNLYLNILMCSHCHLWFSKSY